MGSSKQKTTSSSSTQLLPWQQSAIQNAFTKATSTIDSQFGSSTPNFDTYAGLNSDQTNALTSMLNAGSSQSTAGSSLINQGSALTSLGLNTAGTTLGDYTNAALSGVSGNYNQGTTAASDALMNSGSAYGQTGVAALQSALRQSSGDATTQNATDAASYANSSGVQSAINSAIAQSDQIYNRTTAPSLNAQAAAGGNLNSSRAGAAQAISQAMQSSQDATTASSMWNTAYQQGLSTAEAAREANLSSTLSAANTANTGANTALTAQSDANALANQNNNTQLAYTSDLGSAVQSALSALQTGTGMTSTGQTVQNTGTAQQLSAGNTYQTNQQEANQGAVTGYTDSQQYPWSQLANYLNIIGTNTWGSTSQGTQTTVSTPSTLSMIQGMIGSIAGAATSVAKL